ncbi:hypothetical protein ACOTTU_03320 [Roseobacter sp. EG26]|uniref:hypothetical protein n=1 Tax=Roseobacter sp. EG26 TaxID=3412477 RepID=UPI003CE4EBE8
MIGRKAFFAIAILLIAGPVHAQEVTGFGRFTELPAHRALVAQSIEAKVTGFTTDGCSGGMSDIWRAASRQFPELANTYGSKPPWEACCVTHDRRYHNAGGARNAVKSYQARLRADKALKACVLARGKRAVKAQQELEDGSPETVRLAYTSIAEAMYYAVRAGGGPCSGLSWRWGYGYPNCSVLRGTGVDGLARGNPTSN